MEDNVLYIYQKRFYELLDKEADLDRLRGIIITADIKLDEMLYALSGGNVTDDPIPVSVIEEWIAGIRHILVPAAADEQEG